MANVLAFADSRSYLCISLENCLQEFGHEIINVGTKVDEVDAVKEQISAIVIYADSEELNGFAVFVPLGFTGSKTLPFLLNGGIELLLHSGLGIIRKLLVYETFAMKLKKKYMKNYQKILCAIMMKQQV